MSQNEKLFEQYILDEVNKLLDNHKQQVASDYQAHFSHLGQYVKDSLAPVMQQTAEIDEKNHQRWLEAEASAKARFVIAEASRTVERRIQSACILFAGGRMTSDECINQVMYFEKAFGAK